MTNIKGTFPCITSYLRCCLQHGQSLGKLVHMMVSASRRANFDKIATSRFFKTGDICRLQRLNLE